MFRDDCVPGVPENFSQFIDNNVLAGEENCTHCRISIQYRMRQSSRSKNMRELQNGSDVNLSALNVPSYSN